MYDITGSFPPGTYWSNYVQADFRAITGSPVEQGTSQTSEGFAFTYRVTVEIVPSAAFPLTWADPANNNANFSAPGLTSPSNSTDPKQHQVELSEWQVAKNLQDNLTEIRLRFRWPVLAAGKLGNGTQVYRTTAKPGKWSRPFTMPVYRTVRQPRQTSLLP